jgi:hypothetical protein
VFKFLPRIIKQEKGIKGMKIGKEEIKLFLLADDILQLKDPKGSIRRFLALINTISKVAGYKISIKIPVAFLYTSNKHNEKAIRKTILFTIDSKKKNI